jgi:predicted transcriptional regulator of viral defense system
LKPTEALGHLLRLRRPIIETREAATCLGVSVSRASQLLSSFEQAGLSRRLQRGLWALSPDIDPLSVPPYLTAPLPAYVSFWSALARHGMIEQVPRLIYVASLARTQSIATPVGVYSIHHLVPELFAGYVGSAELGFVAIPEKALFDTVYLRASAGGQVALPELELPKGFRESRLEEWTRLVARARLRTLVSRGLEKAFAEARSTA